MESDNTLSGGITLTFLVGLGIMILTHLGYISSGLFPFLMGGTFLVGLVGSLIAAGISASIRAENQYTITLDGKTTQPKDNSDVEASHSKENSRDSGDKAPNLCCMTIDESEAKEITMPNEWQGYDLDEFPQLLDPESTILESLGDTIGDGEGIDEAVIRKFKSQVRAEALRHYADALEHNPSALVWDKEHFVRDIRDWAENGTEETR